MIIIAHKEQWLSILEIMKKKKQAREKELVLRLAITAEKNKIKYP